MAAPLRHHPLTAKARPRPLALIPALTVVALLGPVVAGLWGTVGPALGVGTPMDPEAAFAQLIAWPGLGAAIRVSVISGVLATLASLAIVILFVAGWSGTRAFARMQQALSPLLSVPHAAAAFALAFLIAPSGWLLRLTSPLTGIERPPDLLIVGDGLGLSLAAGLIVKEVPFLLLLTLAALNQADARRTQALCASMGYGRSVGWLKTMLPGVYAQIRLPVYVVLTYSMSVVDMALILGPTTPPPLAVQVVRWMSDPGLAMRPVAAAAALMQLALVLSALAAWRLGEWVMAAWGNVWATSGRRHARDRGLRAASLLLAIVPAVCVALGLVGLALWSVAGFWAFPDPVPPALTGAHWMRHGPGLAAAGTDTALVAFGTVAIALVLTIGCLESEFRSGRAMSTIGLRILYVPLLIPQVAFLPGLQVLLLRLGADTGSAPVILAHLVFVLPYMLLSLGDPWRTWDARQAVVAQALGASHRRVFWAIRMPLMLRPVLTAVAIGAAVSVGQYLPTLLIGGGRIATLTTEAVALGSGGDRRTIGVYALSQTIASLMPFAVAIGLPAWLYRRRRGLRV